MFHIFLLFTRNTLDFKNRRKGLADKSLIKGKHGSLSLRAWSSYSLLSLIGQIFIINVLCLPNYLLMLAQIDAICIHKEPFIYFLLSSLFSILIFHLLPFLLFLSSFPPVSFPVNVGRTGRSGEDGAFTVAKSTHGGFHEVCTDMCFLHLGCTHFTPPDLRLQPVS